MDLDTGDIVMFNRPCLKLGTFGALVCASAKFAENTPWDHVGVVVRGKDGKLLVADAVRLLAPPRLAFCAPFRASCVG